MSDNFQFCLKNSTTFLCFFPQSLFFMPRKCLFWRVLASLQFGANSRARGTNTACLRASRCLRGSSGRFWGPPSRGRPSRAGVARQACSEQAPVPNARDPVLGPAAVPGASRPPASCQAGPTNVFISDKGQLFGGIVVLLGASNPWNNCCDERSNHLQQDCYIGAFQVQWPPEPLSYFFAFKTFQKRDGQ